MAPKSPPIVTKNLKSGPFSDPGAADCAKRLQLLVILQRRCVSRCGPAGGGDFQVEPPQRPHAYAILATGPQARGVLRPVSLSCLYSRCTYVLVQPVACWAPAVVYIGVRLFSFCACTVQTEVGLQGPSFRVVDCCVEYQKYMINK